MAVKRGQPTKGESTHAAQGFGSVQYEMDSTEPSQPIGDKMYVETRTTHTEVIADMLKAVEQQANSVVNQVVTYRAHPTYNTKTSIRQDLWALYGMEQLARRVSGVPLPDALHAKVKDAVDAVESLKAGA
jgi:hypothetical protein